MKSKKQMLACGIVFLSLFLNACSCEDLHLGKINLEGSLNSFTPVAGKGENVEVRFSNKVGTMAYAVEQDTFLVNVPVSSTGKSSMHGKGATYKCVEYYTAQNRTLHGYSNNNTLPFYLSLLQTKNFNPNGYSDIASHEEVEDVLQITVGYHNKFPNVVTRGMMNYEGYLPTRTFAFSLHPDKLVNKPYPIGQEYHPTITLNGVQHEKVYHLYLLSPGFTADEVFLNSHYELTYIQGIYLKEGFGLVQAYTSKGETIDFSPL
ncbi:hypothetical protein [Pontibacter roseus]|uniref:hypothetical protein n=1 Tax=Pontibacter roseus TaxID=336989 RepID=UPI00036DFDE7|nr:hypothetical protein [Pontibacter roseus]